MNVIAGDKGCCYTKMVIVGKLIRGKLDGVTSFNWDAVDDDTQLSVNAITSVAEGSACFGNREVNREFASERVRLGFVSELIIVEGVENMFCMIVRVTGLDECHLTEQVELG